METLAVGPEAEAKMIMAVHSIFAMMALGDYIAEKLDQSFDELQDLLEDARKILKKM